MHLADITVMANTAAARRAARAPARAVAVRALQKLGRPARTSGGLPDWEAVEAIKASLREAGFDSPAQRLLGWVPNKPVSMTRLAEAFFQRAAQAGLLVD